MATREGRVLISSATDPDFASGYSVTAYEVGAQVETGSSGNTITVRSGHGFAADDRFIVNTDTSKLRKVSVAAATQLTLADAAIVDVSAGDFLINLAQDTGYGSGTPEWDGNGLAIYTDMALANQATNNTVATSATGRYRYFHGAIAIWELIRNGDTPVDFVLDVGLPTVNGAATTTDNAVARWNGTDGSAIQNSSVIIDDSNNVTGVVGLTIGGALGGVTTLAASGLASLTTLALSGNATFGDASTDTYTHVGRMIVRTIAVNPTSSATAGTIGEVVHSSSTNKFYGKITASATDTNWVLLGT